MSAEFCTVQQEYTQGVKFKLAARSRGHDGHRNTLLFVTQSTIMNSYFRQAASFFLFWRY